MKGINTVRRKVDIRQPVWR